MPDNDFSDLNAELSNQIASMPNAGNEKQDCSSNSMKRDEIAGGMCPDSNAHASVPNLSHIWLAEPKFYHVSAESCDIREPLMLDENSSPNGKNSPTSERAQDVTRGHPIDRFFNYPQEKKPACKDKKPACCSGQVTEIGTQRNCVYCKKSSLFPFSLFLGLPWFLAPLVGIIQIGY